jgi:hypothetical protein
VTGGNAGSNAGSLAETLAGNAGSSTGSAPEESLAEIYRWDVKYWTLEQAEAHPYWPPTEGDKMTEYKISWHTRLTGVYNDDPQALVGFTIVEAESNADAMAVFDELIDRDFFADYPAKNKGGVYRIVVDDAPRDGSPSARLVPFDIDTLPETWNFDEILLANLTKSEEG